MAANNSMAPKEPSNGNQYDHAYDDLHKNGIVNGSTTNGVPGVLGKNTPLDDVKQLLANDTKVKVAGIDCDGILRGKIMSREKFLSSLKSGFGMSSAIFGWDMHDLLHTEESSLTSAKDGYADFTALVDLESLRRLPFEDGIPFFLLRFVAAGKPVIADGRGLLRSLGSSMEAAGLRGMAGVELEFMNFQTPSEDGYGDGDACRNLAAFLGSNQSKGLRPLTDGAFGYSILRPIMAKRYFHDIFDTSLQVNCPVEGWHTESGPGVYEAALAVSPLEKMADSVSIFKFVTKAVGVEHGVTPCFMAKPVAGLPGNSGHVHVSLVDLEGTNAFVRDEPDPDPAWSDVAYLSDKGRQFLAGVLDALPDIMPLLAPNINSYKRLVENYWAPVTVSWGYEDRLASVRLITPPSCKPSASRLEIRVPGADMHPHYALYAIFAAGMRGINQQLEIPIPPQASRPEGSVAERLPNTLDKALERFSRKNSVARQIMGEEFVEFYSLSRRHELKLWQEAVTDWEFSRYIETV